MLTRLCREDDGEANEKAQEREKVERPCHGALRPCCLLAMGC